jgi:hypothetical protein
VVATSVTRHPTLSWLKQQIRDACPWDDVRFLIHDNDGIYGQYGKGRGPRGALDAWLGEAMGIHGFPIPYGAPNANGSASVSSARFSERSSITSSSE